MTVEEPNYFRLNELYEELAGNRAEKQGVWVEARQSLSIEEYDSYVQHIKVLEREAQFILEKIESAGGEDPEL